MEFKSKSQDTVTACLCPRVEGKHPPPHWLTMDAAVKHCTEGIGIWQWASSNQAVSPDVVMACCGYVPTLETLAAISILREHLHELKFRVVNAIDIMERH